MELHWISVVLLKQV